jgi:hypothetical protein
MALPLNRFVRKVGIVSTSPVGIYTNPVGYTSLVIFANIANTSNNSVDVTISHQATISGIAVTTEVVQNYPIGANDSLSPFNGKPGFESNDVLIISGSEGDNIKYYFTVLETLQQ